MPNTPIINQETIKLAIQKYNKFKFDCEKAVKKGTFPSVADWAKQNQGAVIQQSVSMAGDESETSKAPLLGFYYYLVKSQNGPSQNEIDQFKTLMLMDLSLSSIAREKLLESFDKIAQNVIASKLPLDKIGGLDDEGNILDAEGEIVAPDILGDFMDPTKNVVIEKSNTYVLSEEEILQEQILDSAPDNNSQDDKSEEKSEEKLEDKPNLKLEEKTEVKVEDKPEDKNDIKLESKPEDKVEEVIISTQNKTEEVIAEESDNLLPKINIDLGDVGSDIAERKVTGKSQRDLLLQSDDVNIDVDNPKYNVDFSIEKGDILRIAKIINENKAVAEFAQKSHKAKMYETDVNALENKLFDAIFDKENISKDANKLYCKAYELNEKVSTPLTEDDKQRHTDLLNKGDLTQTESEELALFNVRSGKVKSNASRDFANAKRNKEQYQKIAMSKEIGKYLLARKTKEARGIFSTIFHPFKAYRERTYFNKMAEQMKGYGLNDQTLDTLYGVMNNNRTQLGQALKFNSAFKNLPANQNLEGSRKPLPQREAELLKQKTTEKGYPAYTRKLDNNVSKTDIKIDIE